jgi:hypothetical protein
MPELNEARYHASACSLGGNIYVIGGYCGDHTFVSNRFLSSIEKLSNPSLSRHAASWKLIIQPPDSVLLPRRFTIVVPINAYEIAILGGDGDGTESLSDVILFDIKTEKCKKEIISSQLGLYAEGNQAA